MNAQLRWLGEQRVPRWGGHLDRGETLSDRQMQCWIDDGLIAAVDEPCRGYVLTDKGRAYITMHSEGK